MTPGTQEPSVTARDEGRRQSKRRYAWKAIRMRKNDERKRKSCRTEGKRLEMARSNVGS
jgi:hypothetical protein